jgi:hypothetical protein
MSGNLGERHSEICSCCPQTLAHLAKIRVRVMVYCCSADSQLSPNCRKVQVVHTPEASDLTQSMQIVTGV